MARTFRMIKFVKDGKKEDFIVSVTWTDKDVEIFFLNSSCNQEQQFKTTIRSKDFEEFSDELSMEVGDLRSKVYKLLTEPQNDFTTFEIIDANFRLSTKSERNSNIKTLVATDLEFAEDLEKKFLLATISELQNAQEELKFSKNETTMLKEQLEILEQEMTNLTDEKVKQEEDLLSKFTLLLNSKKSKIKELRKELCPEDEHEHFSDSDDESLKSPSSDSNSDSEMSVVSKRKSFEMECSQSDDDFSAQTQVLNVLPKRVKLDDSLTRDASPQPGSSKELLNCSEIRKETSQDLLEML